MKEKILTKILAVFFIMIVAVSGAMAISLTKSQTDSLIPTYVGEVITDKQVYYQGDNIQIKWSLAERFNNYMKLIKLVNVETGASINLIQDNEVLGTNYAKATIPNWLPEGYWKVRVTIQPEVEGQTYWDSKDFKVVKKELTLIKIVGLGEAFELRKNGQATLQGTGFTMTLNRLGPLIVCVRAPCDSYPEASITAQIQKPSTANNVAGVSVDINMAVGETKDLFGYTITFEKSDGTVGVFIINKGITQPPVPGVQIVGLGEAFELRKNGQATLQGTGFTMTLNRLGPSIVCVRAPCDSYPEARITVTNKDIYADRAATSVVTELAIKIGESKEVFGYIVRFEKSDGKTAVFIIDKKIIVTPEPGGPQVVQLGQAFEMQKNSKVSVEGTGLGINLHSITGLTICSTGTIDNPEASGCQVFWEAKVTATNQNLMLKNPTIDSNRLMPSSIGTDFTIKTGDSKNVFGYVLRFEKSDGQTAVFIVDKVLNPVIEFDSTSSGYVISGEGYISSPTMKSEGQETNMGVKSITYTPGDMSIRVKTKNSNDVQEIYADLQEGILVPTTKEGQSRNILIKSDYSNLELSLQDEDVVATTRAEIVSKESGLYVKSSDGRELEVKILPSVAAERAREVLGEKYDRIELKDGGRLSYEVSKDYQGRIVGIIPIKVRHSALIDADSGNLIETQKPWYNFLVTGQK